MGSQSIKGTGQLECQLQGTSVYGKKEALGQWRSKRFHIFVGGPLNMFKVHDRNKGVSLKEHEF